MERATREITKEMIIPDEHTLKVAQLIDDSRKDDNFHVGNYRLWSFLHEIFPETKSGEWSINASKATQFKVFQQDEATQQEGEE